MTKIKDDDLIKIHLKARALSEAAMIAAYTPENSDMSADRKKWAEEAAQDLLKALESNK